MGVRVSNQLGDARTRLFDALAPVFVDPVDGWTFAGRLHRTQPARLAAPCVYLGASAGSRRTGQASSYVATFPVTIIYDGANEAQVDGLEEVISRVHDAAHAAGMTPTGHDPAVPPAPAGGGVSTLSAAVVMVDVTFRSYALCTHPVIPEAVHV